MLAGQASAAEPVSSPSPSPNEQAIKPAETVPSPFPISIIETSEQAVFNQRREAENKRHEASDLDAQIRAANAAEGQIFPAWLGAILSFIGTILLTWTLWESRKATKAARDGADSAEKALRSDRAWMTIGGYNNAAIQNGVIDGIPVNEGVAFGVRWINTGRSPAINCTCYIAQKIVPKGEAPPFFAASGADEPRSTAIGTNQDISSIWRALNDQETAMLKDRKVDWFIYSRVDYFDIFAPDTIRTSEACFRVEYNGKKTTENGELTPLIHVNTEGEQNRVT